MTLNELRAALDKLVAERPECGEMPVHSVDCDAGEYVIGSVLPRAAGEDSCSHQAHEPLGARVVLAAEGSRGCPWCGD